MSTRLFKRVATVTAYTASIQAGAWFQPQPNAIAISDLRVKFSVEKHTDKEPNTAVVEIYNCAATTRGFLSTKPLIVRIDAGHDGVSRHLFTGDLRLGPSRLEGVDWITKLTLADGDRAYRYARVSRSYKKGTQVMTALRDAGQAMGLLVPSNVAVSSELQQQFATGVSLHGPARDELTRLLAPYGYHWSIQDGRLQILKDADASPSQAWVISQDTGMIGTPQISQPTKPGAAPTLTIKMLLFPEITPGGKIEVTARNVKGVYRVERVTHTGDTHDEDWTSEIEAKQA